MKRSGKVFPSDMTQGQYINLQRSWKVKVTFVTIWFFTDNFWTKHDRDKIRTTSCSSRHDASKHYTCWPRKVKVKIWPQVKVTVWPKLHISWCVLTRQTHWDHFHVSSSSQFQVIGKKLLVTSGDFRDFSGVTDQHLTLGHHEWPKSTWPWKNCAILMRWEGFQYFPHWFIMERSGASPDPRS